jgi:hypothetical protein
MYRIVEEYVSDISLYLLLKNDKVVLMTNRYDLALRELKKNIYKV